MSHLVENMFYVGEKPWHGLGKKLDLPPTSEDAIREAGLDWKVKVVPIQVGDHFSKEFMAIQRETDGEIYGVVKKRYAPLQNSEAFAFFDPIVTAGTATYHTAGSLAKGSKVWILAKLEGEMEVAKGDIVEKFLLLSNGHNGRNGINIQFTPIRVVCNNTLTAAEAESLGLDKKRRVIHSSKAVKSLEEVREIINFATQTFDETLVKYRRLAEAGIPSIEEYVVKSLYKASEAKAILSSGKIGRSAEKVISLFKNDPTNNISNISGSAWAAYNSVTQFVDHFRGHDSTRLDQAWFGNGQATKQRAFDLALRLAA